MTELTIRLNDVKNVQDFNKLATKQGFSIDVRSLDRHYCIDAKSLMGLFSLDLSKPVLVSVEVDSPDVDKFFTEIAEYVR